MKQLAKSGNMLLLAQVVMDDAANSCICELMAAETITHIIPADSSLFASAPKVSLQNSGKFSIQ
jgi:hypothetical protein